MDGEKVSMIYFKYNQRLRFYFATNMNHYIILLCKMIELGMQNGDNDWQMLENQDFLINH